MAFVFCSSGANGEREGEVERERERERWRENNQAIVVCFC